MTETPEALLRMCAELDEKAAKANPGGKTHAERWVAVEVQRTHWLIRTENEAGYGRMIGQTAGCTELHAAFAAYIAAAGPSTIRKLTAAVREGIAAQQRLAVAGDESRAAGLLATAEAENRALRAEVQRLRRKLRGIANEVVDVLAPPVPADELSRVPPALPFIGVPPIFDPDASGIGTAPTQGE